VESLKRTYKQDWFDEEGPLFRIRVTLVRDEATISLDTSGVGLHRRGYRTLNAAAPLRETLAAGLILLSYWNASRILVDPFCGSGTIPIEAAFIGLDRAPGLRRAFASEGWPFVGKRLWEGVRKEAEERFDRTTRLQITGHDVDPKVLDMARYHLRQAELVERGVHFRPQPVSAFRTSKKYGVVITNPPYGDRLGERAEAEKVYRELGQVMKPHPTWSVYVLTSHPRFDAFFGQSLVRKRKLYNAMIIAWYYQFPGPPPPREPDPDRTELA
jgi:putative N6-adenine-specific DNA methylase